MDMVFEYAGYIGIAMLLVAYFLTTAGHMRATDTPHILMNVLGTLLLFVAMRAGYTVPVFIVLPLWLCISLFGLYKHFAVAETTE